MEDYEEIREEDVFERDGDMDPESALPQEGGKDLEEEVEKNVVAAEDSKAPIQISHRFKLVEILKNIHSPELKIYSDASKEFMSLLRADSGGEILREYVQLSAKCTELSKAWQLHQGNPGMSFIMSMITVILGHPDGKSQPVSIRKNLDNFARLLVEDKMDDIYGELNSQEWRRQSAALFLLASVIRRGMGLASEVAKRFDFKLPVLLKLSGVLKKKNGKDVKHVKMRSTRRAFVQFAMSFIEVGNPRLLRWILQQRDIYSGVLRGIASDDTDTVILVLSTLHCKVLTKDSLLPPGLRSVLFGSVTLEQLSLISGNPTAGPAADIAHEILVMVCTDPQNGLMPGSGLKGNRKRLLDFMRKLKATEVKFHKQLVLAIVKGRPAICSAYMDEFPYYLEPRSSSSWFSAISLAADIIFSIDYNALITTMTSHSLDQPISNSEELHNIMKCVIPRAFTRSVINKGLLHADNLVKHGSLRLVLESLKALDCLVRSIKETVKSMIVRQGPNTTEEKMASLHNLPGFNYFVHVKKHFSGGEIASSPDNVRTQYLVSLKQYIENEIRAELPDPQVLLKLLSSIQRSAKDSGIGVKRSLNQPKIRLKKIKSDKASENIDIFIGGLDTLTTEDAAGDFRKAPNESVDHDLEVKNDQRTVISEIWGYTENTTFCNEPKDAENFFHSKLFDGLKFYLRTMPIAFEGSFDFFKVLPNNPLNLSIDQQRSLLSLLAECIGQSVGNRNSAGASKVLYKHLQPLINFLLYTQAKDIQDQAYTLVRAAMISTGAFDLNLSEIGAWFLFLPGYIKNVNIVQNGGVEALQNLSAIVISFLCDAVSTIGNNLYKYLYQMRELLSEVDDINDHSVCFSPLIICVLQKCLRLLESDSETFKLHEKSMISLYVGNTLSLILHTQYLLMWKRF